MNGFTVQRGLLTSLVLATLLLVISLSGITAQSRLPGLSFPAFNARTKIDQNLETHDLLDDVSNATLGFEKIFVVNLASRTDRRDAATLAAALTGLQFEFVKAVTHVDKKFLPPPGTDKVNLKFGALAAWRSHANILRRIVEENITSALILEDDADWDIRIKAQMRDFARASRRLLQPLSNGTDEAWKERTPELNERASEPSPVNVLPDDANITEPTTSPYGDIDRWDMLWIGHCGVALPHPDNSTATLPSTRVVIPNDTTVPPSHAIQKEFSDTQLVMQYPDHTRVVAQTRTGTCSLAYGVSQLGARKLLWETAIRALTGPMDMMYRSMCDGTYGREMITCLSPSPALFGHHRPAGDPSTWSNIDDLKDAVQRDYPTSGNVRWGARFNTYELLSGGTEYFDPFMEGQ
ncbi:glycosyltransferase family 25 protein [Cercospora zeae-maydis SCOH1-5]|uniref:Glycosyltransferase family 25 protein n=1 Tax=Cercospora zeae-maydis SCOH1-5 TaxID=717836 RepID=A0A6A6F4A2_9PEZI|nr:glycosyltransferase family 25 protein [Cercospora zeae-maydis SCOH1-5]